jgi:gamma-glutamyltranspeptidase/glutathione hydrolase
MNSSGTRIEPVAQATRPYAVAAAHPLATDAGISVLAAGGSAVDAAVAIQAVLGLVEPQSSGLAGGAFLLYFDAATRRATCYEGRIEAPLGAEPSMFLREDGTPMDYLEASRTGRVFGVPGVVAMLARAHQDHGELPWSELFKTAIRLATDGIRVSPRMAGGLELAVKVGASDEFVGLYSNGDGTLLREGDSFVNAPYAETLRSVADDWRSFYSGAIAESIIAAISREPMPGVVTLEDLASYEAHVHEPICRPYREWRVCGPPPPTSTVTALSILGQLESFDLAAEPATPAAWHLFVEASQRAYADRELYLADDRFIEVPVDALLDPGYLAQRAGTIDPEIASRVVEPGRIDGFPRAVAASPEPGGTSHLVVADARGNVVSMSTSVGFVSGTRRVAGGLVLNSNLTDFSFVPARDGVPVANAVAPRKRPRSAMIPLLVLDTDGSPRLALGSPGGISIIAYVTKTIVGVLDWGLSGAEAIELPSVVPRGGSVAIEGDRAGALVEALRDFGHDVGGTAYEGSGIHLIEIDTEGVIRGGADSRREGTFRVSDG